MTIDELSSRLEILDVIAKYAVHMDEGEFEALEPLFAEDAVFDVSPDPEIVPNPLRGRDAIIDALRARHELVQKDSQHRHVMTNTAFDELDGDRARTRTFLTVLSAPHTGGVNVRGCGLYSDVLERRDGRWVIAERKVMLDALGPGRVGVDPAGVL
jgi:3-phenylpropionate/cinnamic acid dioxygenase small subunit